MSDSKQGIKIRGSNDKSPAVLSTAPSGTEDGLAVWVVNPSGGGGAADQGKKGSAPESWYVQDGSGLLATAAKQDDGNNTLSSIKDSVATESTLLGASASLASIDGKLTAPINVTGPLTNTELRAAAVPVSAVSLPLPSGAATAAKQPALGVAGTPSSDVLSVQGVSGGTPVKTDGSAVTQPVSAASLPLPAGAATSALQGGGLPAALVGGRLDANVGAWLGSTAPTVGQKTAANSLPVVLASDTGTLTVATSVTAGTSAVETYQDCSTAQIVLPAIDGAKHRSVYNHAGNGRLLIRLGSVPTSENDCNFVINPGDTWEMPTIAPGVPMYSGDVYGLILSGSSSVNGTQVT